MLCAVANSRLIGYYDHALTWLQIHVSFVPVSARCATNPCHHHLPAGGAGIFTVADVNISSHQLVVCNLQCGGIDDPGACPRCCVTRANICLLEAWLLTGGRLVIQVVFLGRLTPGESSSLTESLVKYCLFKLVFVGALLPPGMGEVAAWVGW